MLLKTKLRKLSEDFQLWDGTISTTCPGFKIDEILYHHDAWLLRQPNEMGTNASGQEKAVSEIPNSPVAGWPREIQAQRLVQSMRKRHIFCHYLTVNTVEYILKETGVQRANGHIVEHLDS